MKILITGYSRSGTTLLRKLLTAHPNVKRIFHESMFLVMNRGGVYSNSCLWTIKGEAIKLLFDVNKETWGEKILYDHPCVDYGVIDAFDYCLFWNEVYGSDAYIVDIVRYPFDVIISSSNKRGVSVKTATDFYLRRMPSTHKNINSLNNCITIKFEDILLHKEVTLEEVFEHCCLDSSRRAIKETLSCARPDLQFEKVEPKMAFRHDGRYSEIDDARVEQIAEKLEYHV